jgi:hypothetical protein
MSDKPPEIVKRTETTASGRPATAKKVDLERREMPKQSPEVRRHNFNEVALGYTPELAMQEASRCLNCKKPKCTPDCPVEIDIPGFIQDIAAGDFAAGIHRIKQKNCLPAITGRVCPQEGVYSISAAGRSLSVGWNDSWRIGKLRRRRLFFRRSSLLPVVK